LQRPAALSATIHSGDHVAPQAIRALDDPGVDVLDVDVKRPTLDDVFLQLTARRTESGEDEGVRDGPGAEQ
jgi:ABC-2 type transport system ATP-binding protein